MANTFALPSEGQRIPASRSRYDDDRLDADPDSEVISLLEENARLRALVTKLSDLILRHVAGEK